MKRGDIVRFGHGPTALARLSHPHAGGWMAEHCMGGSTYVRETLYKPWRLADEADLKVWRQTRWYRCETPTEKPHLLCKDGRWAALSAHRNRFTGFRFPTPQMAFHRLPSA